LIFQPVDLWVKFITEGRDYASSSSADDVVQAAKSNGVRLYSIGIGSPNSPAAMSIATEPSVIDADDEEHVDAVTLSRLASANGSKSCFSVVWSCIRGYPHFGALTQNGIPWVPGTRLTCDELASH
jgi:hypothetical protein